MACKPPLWSGYPGVQGKMGKRGIDGSVGIEGIEGIVGPKGPRGLPDPGIDTSFPTATYEQVVDQSLTIQDAGTGSVNIKWNNFFLTTTPVTEIVASGNNITLTPITGYNILVNYEVSASLSPGYSDEILIKFNIDAYDPGFIDAALFEYLFSGAYTNGNTLFPPLGEKFYGPSSIKISRDFIIVPADTTPFAYSMKIMLEGVAAPPGSTTTVNISGMKINLSYIPVDGNITDP